ncbi:MAG: PQQ-binding-like beta-propeller repeat protein [Methanothrix sp.]
MNARKKPGALAAWAAALLMTAIIATGVSAENAGDWPQFHLDAAHIGASDFGAPLSNETAWISQDIGAQEGSSVAIADGRVLVNCVENLVCLDQLSGEVLWNASFEARPDICQVWGASPVYSDGKVFLSALKTICLNASDGELLWSYAHPTGKGAVDGGPAVADGRVLTSDWDGHHYYCLDEETGNELWRFTVQGNAQSTPAISGSRVVLSGWEWGLGGRVYCLNLDNGTEIWNLSTENSPCGSAALSKDTAYLTTYNFEGDGDVLSLSLQNGSLLWKESIARTDCTPALAPGRIYVCGGTDGYSDKATYCLDAQTGELIWKTTADEGIGEWRCSPAYADGLLYVGRTENMNYTTLYALNASTGEAVWSYPAGGSSPAIAGGMVFTIGQGRVHAIGRGGDAK